MSSPQQVAEAKKEFYAALATSSFLTAAALATFVGAAFLAMQAATDSKKLDKLSPCMQGDDRFYAEDWDHFCYNFYHNKGKTSCTEIPQGCNFTGISEDPNCLDRLSHCELTKDILKTYGSTTYTWENGLKKLCTQVADDSLNVTCPNFGSFSDGNPEYGDQQWKLAGEILGFILITGTVLVALNFIVSAWRRTYDLFCKYNLIKNQLEVPLPQALNATRVAFGSEVNAEEAGTKEPLLAEGIITPISSRNETTCRLS